MNEFELIARLTRDLPSNATVVAGPGDDCALLDLGIPGRWMVLKIDATIEGIHFTSESPPEKVGHKALGRVLSDFAAAGATPSAVVVTLALPPQFNPDQIEAIYAGLRALAARWDVAIVGGETTTCPERIALVVAGVGTVDRDRAVRRSGALAGDAVFVSGELGGSIEGHHLDFQPRLAESRWLVDHFSVHAMIDVSDGLAGDLRHLLRASGVGAEILVPSIPISPAARRRARQGSTATPALTAALSDGEDFELLFTVASGDAVAVLDGWKRQFPTVRLTCIGRITSAPGLQLLGRKGTVPMPEDGYTHFA